MQGATPWTLAKIATEDDVDEVIFLCAESLRISGILLQPFMPTKMKTLLDMLGVSEDARGFENAVLGSDKDYGVPMIDLGKDMEGVLFPPLTAEYDEE